MAGLPAALLQHRWAGLFAIQCHVIVRVRMTRGQPPLVAYTYVAKSRASTSACRSRLQDLRKVQYPRLQAQKHMHDA